jgi:hypothetical protein
MTKRFHKINRGLSACLEVGKKEMCITNHPSGTAIHYTPHDLTYCCYSPMKSVFSSPHFSAYFHNRSKDVAAKTKIYIICVEFKKVSLLLSFPGWHSSSFPHRLSDIHIMLCDLFLWMLVYFYACKISNGQGSSKSLLN